MKKLSICMIVKNEEANLHRCLDSFLPIINMQEGGQRLCELIIVDTGSTDRTIEVAKKYTDKIFEKKFDPWSFSDARNYSISKATGEKILILDADEELKQRWLYPLMDLIHNDKFKNYPSFFFYIDSVHDKHNMRTSSFQQPRMFKREGFKYEGRVHNKPKCKQPYIFTDIHINHYGYQFDDVELAKRKFERSLPLLLKDYKENPHDTHVLTHLVKTYRITNKTDKVIEYGLKWIEEMSKIKYHEGWFAYLEVFIDLVEAYTRDGKVDKALEIVKEAEKYSNRIADMYNVLGFYYMNQAKDDKKAIEYFEKVLYIYKTPGSVYEDLLTQNYTNILPKVYNYLARIYYIEKNLLKSGQYLNEGIRMRSNLPLRWDIWNYGRNRNAA